MWALLMNNEKIGRQMVIIRMELWGEFVGSAIHRNGMIGTAAAAMSML